MAAWQTTNAAADDWLASIAELRFAGGAIVLSFRVLISSRLRLHNPHAFVLADAFHDGTNDNSAVDERTTRT